MKNNFTQEISVSLVLLVLLILTLNPFQLWMPDMLTMTLVICLLVAFAIFAGFVWQEKSRDERETLHRLLAGRLANLAGMTILVFGVLVQSYNHQLDPWLIGALVVMILAKAGGLIYGQLKK